MSWCVSERADHASAAGIGDERVDEDEGQDDHDDADRPRNQIESPGVGVVAHQIATINKEQEKDKDHGKPDAVGYLRQQKNFEERGVRQQNNPAAHDDQSRVEGVEGGSFFHLVVDSGFESQTFPNYVRGG